MCLAGIVPRVIGVAVEDMEKASVRMFDCCLQGIEPCECKGKGYQWVGNQVFR